jgi:nucleoside-diphosphate-sugar epimerase
MAMVVSKRRIKTTLKVLVDAGIGALALGLALVLRFEGEVLPMQGYALLGLVLGVAVFKTVGSHLGASHRHIWHYTSIQEVTSVTVSAAVTSAVLGLVSLANLLPLPLSVVVIDFALFTLGSVGVRFIRRQQVSYIKRRGGVGPSEKVRTIVIGAGDTANSLLSDLESRNHTNWDVVGLLDDAPSRRGARLRGYEVLGPTTRLTQEIQARGVKHVVVAMPSAEKAVIRHLINRAERAGATVQAVPALEDLLRNGKPLSDHVPITLEDLVDSAEVKKTLLSRVRRDRSRETILVTGGAGYIGSHVVRKLLDRGYRVRVLDNFLYGSAGIDPLRGHELLEVVEGDISSIRDVVSAVKDADAVIALAAIVGDPACGLNAEETLNLNYESTKVLVEGCNFYGVQRLVFASSCSVYGASNSELLTEASPLNPVSLYARTRIMSEDVIFSRCGDVVPVVLRLSTVFGLSPRMRFDLVVNTLTARAVVDRRIQIFGGDQWRPFVHCQDAAEAFIRAALALPELVRSEIFNVGSNDMNSTIGGVGALVAAEVGEDVTVESVPVLDDPRNYRVSFDKIESALGFQARYTLRQGIAEMIEAFEDTPHLRDYENVAFSNLKFLRDRFEASGTLVEEGAGYYSGA